jgi:hypothetical protein
MTKIILNDNMGNTRSHVELKNVTDGLFKVGGNTLPPRGLQVLSKKKTQYFDFKNHYREISFYDLISM